MRTPKQKVCCLKKLSNKTYITEPIPLQISMKKNYPTITGGNEMALLFHKITDELIHELTGYGTNLEQILRNTRFHNMSTDRKRELHTEFFSDFIYSQESVTLLIDYAVQSRNKKDELYNHIDNAHLLIKRAHDDIRYLQQIKRSAVSDLGFFYKIPSCTPLFQNLMNLYFLKTAPQHFERLSQLQGMKNTLDPKMDAEKITYVQNHIDRLLNSWFCH